MPTSRWLALMTRSLHRIADHCKRYEVTITEGTAGSASLLTDHQSDGCVSLAWIVTRTMRKAWQLFHRKLFIMLWLK